MTGVRTIASNYPGTTLGYTKRRMRYGDQTLDLKFFYFAWVETNPSRSNRDALLMP